MKPRKAKRIASVASWRRPSLNAYNREARRVVMEARARGWVCPVMKEILGENLFVECVHHMRGKHCEALRHDKRGWLLVTLWGHRWIDQNRAEAMRRGWLGPRGKWNVLFAPDEKPHPGSVADLLTQKFKG